MGNTDIYNLIKAVPSAAQKPIESGRLKGKTDINPMWRIYKLTEVFGMVGFGWKYEIVRSWLEQGATGVVSAFVQINLFVKVDEKWSDAIPGMGGSSFVAAETARLYTSDECYKMALTDAISVSCKALGMGADVYWSHGSKYSTANDTPEQRKDEIKTVKKATAKVEGKIIPEEHMSSVKLMIWIRACEVEAQQKKERFSIFNLLDMNYKVTDEQKNLICKNYQDYKINNSLS